MYTHHDWRDKQVALLKSSFQIYYSLKHLVAKDCEPTDGHNQSQCIHLQYVVVQRHSVSLFRNNYFPDLATEGYGLGEEGRPVCCYRDATLRSLDGTHKPLNLRSWLSPI
jgi:hypothetical protein